MIYQRYAYENDSSVAVDFTLDHPGRQWVPSAPAVGGIEFAAAGVPASWEQRADYLLHQRIRITEAEYAAVEAMLEHARRGTPITVYPDSAGAGRVCYAEEEWAKSLWSPGIKPQPADFPGMLEIETVWRSTTGTWAGVGFYG